MKHGLTNILLLGAIGLMVFMIFFKGEEKQPEPVVIRIPEYKGTIIDTLETVVRDTVYMATDTVVVDSVWKERYNEAIDSLEKQRLYYEAIEINNYEQTLVDNDTINIKGYATTRGSLLDYSVDYKLKSFDFSYIPDVVSRRPSLSVGVGAELGVPSSVDTNFALKGNIYFENDKGNRFNLGYDTDRRFWLGYSKTFKIKD